MDTQYSRQRYSPCDSFFVETDQQYSMAERVREHERLMGKLRQRELAAELSQVTSDEYLEEILDHMERMEEITMPDVSSIDIQHEIKWYMRPFLMDFLVEAHAAFSLLPETLYLTINILDRYCSRRVVYKRHYQLVACASLLIAAKYGDKKDRVPTFRELRSVCCQLYEEEMFMQMEWHVLQTLDYLLGHPTVDSFLQIALTETARDDPELHHMTYFMCEIALYQRDFVSVRPSVLSRSALALARHVLGRPEVNQNLWGARSDVNIMCSLHDLLAQPSTVLSQKFSSLKLSSVAQKVEAYLHNQQQKAKQDEMMVEAPPTYSINVVPSTPQKVVYETAVQQYGCYTPPITPESDNTICGAYAPSAPPYPTTPSPIPSHHTHHQVPQHMQFPRPDVYYDTRPVQ